MLNLHRSTNFSWMSHFALHQVPRLRIRRGTPELPPYVFMTWRLMTSFVYVTKYFFFPGKREICVHASARTGCPMSWCFVGMERYGSLSVSVTSERQSSYQFLQVVSFCHPAAYNNCKIRLIFLSV
jgi:hypothetical protein